jgi:hypothetical protein
MVLEKFLNQVPFCKTKAKTEQNTKEGKLTPPPGIITFICNMETA